MHFRGLLFIFTFILVSCFVEGNDEDLPDLKWPSQYSLKANKLSLTAGWVEDVTYWRTSKKSRTDYNKGAVKYISVTPRLKSKLPFGVKYEIHPESTEEENNKLKCIQIKGTIHDTISLSDILPEESKFERVDTEILELGEVEKFSYQESGDVNVKSTLWAAYKNGTWIPVRYEEIEYNVWFGRLTKHNLWNYFDFEKKVNNSVFKMDQYNCTEQEVHLNDEAVTKDLKFIDPENKNHVDHVFDVFKRHHTRQYADEKEYNMRKNIFQNNMRLIIENNRKNTGYKLSVNKFADRTPAEMKKYKGLIRKPKRDPGTHPFPYSKSQLEELSKTLPKEFDLRTLGFITPVQDQEDCGSCWTFGTTSAAEGALARANGGRLLRLSNQALIDCSWGFENSGCDGGTDVGAYQWMIEHGLPTEEEYGSYANKDGFCNIKNMTKLHPIRGFINVTPFSVEALKVAIVNHGPLSVSVHATEAFGLYSGGVFYDPNCNALELDHEVTLVGYGERDGEEYWIVKNSWGQTWGVDGYIHVSVRDNNCGVDTEPTYVVI